MPLSKADRGKRIRLGSKDGLHTHTKFVVRDLLPDECLPWDEMHLVPQLALWTLWSRNRAETPQGVFSHLTALAIKDLSDANPARLHMTVPPDFRRNSEIPKVLVLHKAVLAPDEIIRERGYALTTPMRAILDLAHEGEVERDIIEQAFREGQIRGLITRREIAKAQGRTDFPAWMQHLLKSRA